MPGAHAQCGATPSTDWRDFDRRPRCRRLFFWMPAGPSRTASRKALSRPWRVAAATLFWRSGQTKVEGFQLNDTALYLFREEYKVPLLPPDVAAYMATTAEHVFPVLLVLGLASRLSALALLGMTA